ncbi:hypothetical protein DFP72DRAFT_846945 [Ephemerocybe angulata]|uniref:Uncharacterized protein n=1 Tax=Ephemerocybe angulata TaxID=980116 RepID=A0A8H6M644_9AGAR|nr:hypothetical protein DFP72DRAFT_846945 [Tulosesus angulatus]
MAGWPGISGQLLEASVYEMVNPIGELMWFDALLGAYLMFWKTAPSIMLGSWPECATYNKALTDGQDKVSKSVLRKTCFEQNAESLERLAPNWCLPAPIMEVISNQITANASVMPARTQSLQLGSDHDHSLEPSRQNALERFNPELIRQVIRQGQYRIAKRCLLHLEMQLAMATFDGAPPGNMSPEELCMMCMARIERQETRL